MIDQITDLTELNAMLQRAMAAYNRFPDKDNEAMVDAIEQRIADLKAAQPVYHGKLNISNADYHAAPGISSSSLKYLEESPLHFEKRHLFKKTSQTLNMGSLVHALVLEPDITKTEFAISVKYDGRTTAGKAAKAEFEAANVGKIIITEPEYEQACLMARNVLAIAGGLFEGGEAESSYFCEQDGLLLKCRPDYLQQHLSICSDIKTTARISDFDLRRTISEYRYDRSAAFYTKTLAGLGIHVTNFAFVFVESTEPYMVRIRMIDAESLLRARDEVDLLLATYTQYKLSGKGKYYKFTKPFANVGIGTST